MERYAVQLGKNYSGDILYLGIDGFTRTLDTPRLWSRKHDANVARDKFLMDWRWRDEPAEVKAQRASEVQVITFNLIQA